MVESTTGFLKTETSELRQVHEAMKAKLAIAEGQKAEMEA